MATRSAGPTVLLVQPNDDNLEMYIEYFESQHVLCLAASTVADALAQAPNADIVITGIQLRGAMDGVDLIHRLRSDASTRRLPIIVLTACALDNARARVEDAGCDAFLSKPCFPDTLLHTMQQVLRSCTAPRPRIRRRR